jgi:hypothetical protein
MRKATVVLIMVLASGLILAACGGDDDDNGTTTAALSKEEFIAQGDEVCKKANKELDQSEGPQGANGLDEFVTSTLVPNIQGQVDGLREIGVPEGEDQVNTALDNADEALDKLKQDPSQLENGGAGKQLEQAGNELQQYGFKACGN